MVSLLPPSLETSNPCWAERTPADLSPVPGGGEDVSCELEGENQALRDEISDQRVWRPKRCQTPRRPNQMHVVPGRCNGAAWVGARKDRGESVEFNDGSMNP